MANSHHHIDASKENAECGGLEEDIGTFLFSSESVGEGHPGKKENFMSMGPATAHQV